MKLLFYSLLLLILFASCKSTSSSVSTSKKTPVKTNSNKFTVLKKKSEEQKARIYKKDSKEIEFLKIEPNKKLVVSNYNYDIVLSSNNVKKLCNQLVDDALKNIGSPYKYGGITKKGYDCSGLLYATFKEYDIILPRTSIEMSKIGRFIEANDAKKGDFIFFTTNGKTIINHLGMIVEVDNTVIKFIHSSSSKGVIISSTNENYYSNCVVQINRIIE